MALEDWKKKDLGLRQVQMALRGRNAVSERNSGFVCILPSILLGPFVLNGYLGKVAVRESKEDLTRPIPAKLSAERTVTLSLGNVLTPVGIERAHRLQVTT
jgi:hypothetical protein